jgi:hypothetical protein
MKQTQIHDIDQPHTGLAKELGLKEALAIAIGAMIGGGIFTALGRVASLAGPFAVISFFLGGVISLFTAHSYVKLISKYPSAGGEFVILRRGFKNPMIGNFIGILLWLGYSVTIALYASTFGAYVSAWFFQMFNLPFFDPYSDFIFSFRKIMSAFSIFLFMVINLRGVKETGLVQNIIVSFKLSVLLLLAFVGMFFIQPHRYIDSMNKVVPLGDSVFFTFFSGIFVGGAIIFVSYEGFQVIANTVEELKNPTKIVPVAMYVSVVLVAFTYMAVTFVAIGLIDGEITETALIQAVQFLGPVAVTLVTLGAIASTTSAINATILGSSRLAYVMSDWNAFPKKLAAISKKTKVPYISITMTSLMSYLFTALGDASKIAEVGSIIFLCIFLSINFSVLKIYKDEKNYVSKIAVALITLNLFLAIYFVLFLSHEDQSFAFIILFLFSFVTIIWVVINFFITRNVLLKTESYQLKPLGHEMIKEFQYYDESDEFFIDLESMLLPISGDVYETKALQFSAYLGRKYGVKVTLLRIIKSESQRSKDEESIQHVIKVMQDFKVKFELKYKIHQNIADGIIESYNEGKFQLVVLASKRKRGYFDRLFEKSVSKKVVKSVSSSVLQIYPPKYGVKNPDIGDLFVLLDGTLRDEYLIRWAQLVASGGIPSKLTAYYVNELPSIFPLDEAVKVPTIAQNSIVFQDYVIKLGKRYNLAIKPNFMVGHNFVSTIVGEAEQLEPDAIIVGHSKDKGFRNRIRPVKSQKLIRKVSSAVIIHHMPEIPEK